jgi:hypothetical protein
MYIFGKISWPKSWWSHFTRRIMEMPYSCMINTMVCLTRLVKDKLDRPYWELIGNNRQHSHLFRSFFYLVLPFTEAMCSWKCVYIVKACNGDVCLQKFCLFTFLIRAPFFIHQKHRWAHFLHSFSCTTSLELDGLFPDDLIKRNALHSLK